MDCNNIISIMHTIYSQRTDNIQSLNLEHAVNFTLNFCNKHNMDINLRDILRWVDVTIKLDCNILDHLPLIFTDRNANLKKFEDEVIII